MMIPDVLGLMFILPLLPVGEQGFALAGWSGLAEGEGLERHVQHDVLNQVGESLDRLIVAERLACVQTPNPSLRVAVGVNPSLVKNGGDDLPECLRVFGRQVETHAPSVGGR